MNILIVKLSAIGDIIHALPVSYALKKLYPDSHITWVTETIGANIIRHNPCVDEIIIFEKHKFKQYKHFKAEFSKLYRRLHERHYNLSIDLQGLFKSACIIALANADTKIGYCNLREGSSLISRKIVGPYAHGHIVDRYLDVLSIIDPSYSYREDPVFPFTPSLEDKQHIDTLTCGLTKKMVLLAIGTNWPNKTWTDQGYAEVIEELCKLNYQPIIIGNGPKDEAKALRIFTLLPPIIRKLTWNFIGKTSLSQLAALIQRAQLVIGGDTGNLHLAAGFNIPVIMLMGPTDATRNGPYHQEYNVVTVNRPCIHCWKRKCKFGYNCLEPISAKEVLNKALPLLGESLEK